MPQRINTRDPKGSPRTRRALDQLQEILATTCTRLESSTTQAGNTAATQTDLFAYAMPGQTLSDGDTAEFMAAGTFAATASADKRIRVKLGTTTLFDSGNLNITTAQSWVVRGSVSRNMTTQKCQVTLITSDAALVAKATYTSASETLSESVTLSITGQGTNANDVVGQLFKVTRQPA